MVSLSNHGILCSIFDSSDSVTKSLISTLVFSSKEELFLGIHKTSKHDEYCLSGFFFSFDYLRSRAHKYIFRR